MVTKAMKSTPTASRIMSVGGVVREGGADGDKGDQIRADKPVKDYVSRRRCPCSVVPVVTTEIKPASVASEIMSVGGVVREGGPVLMLTDSDKDCVIRRRGP